MTKYSLSPGDYKLFCLSACNNFRLSSWGVASQQQGAAISHATWSRLWKACNKCSCIDRGEEAPCTVPTADWRWRKLGESSCCGCGCWVIKSHRSLNDAPGRRSDYFKRRRLLLSLPVRQRDVRVRQPLCPAHSLFGAKRSCVYTVKGCKHWQWYRCYRFLFYKITSYKCSFDKCWVKNKPISPICCQRSLNT